MFILYNKHTNNHYSIYLTMTDVAVVEEQISHNTF